MSFFSLFLYDAAPCYKKAFLKFTDLRNSKFLERIKKMDITFFIHEDHTPGAVNWEAPWNYAHNFPKLTLNRGSFDLPKKIGTKIEY
jgi:hypothetical protein